MRARSDGAFPRALLVVHGLSFLGGVYYLLPRSVQTSFPYLSGFVPSHRPYPGWRGTFFAEVGDSVAGGVSLAVLALLLFLAVRLGRSPGWARAAGAAFVVLTLLWTLLAIAALRSVSSDGAMVAFYVCLAAATCVAGAVASFAHATRLPEGSEATTAHDAQPALWSQRAWARAWDFVIVGLAFVLQTVLTDAIGGVGSSGSSSERWLSSLRWIGAFLAEATCVALVGATPGKAVMGIRVRRDTRSRLGSVRSLVRAGLVFFGIFFAWTLYAVTFRRVDRAGLHDLAVGSRVVAMRPRLDGGAA